MMKIKRKRIYKKYNLDDNLINICEAIYKYNKKHGYYFTPSLRCGRTLINNVLREILL